jgi:hypothetical protein
VIGPDANLKFLFFLETFIHAIPLIFFLISGGKICNNGMNSDHNVYGNSFYISIPLYYQIYCNSLFFSLLLTCATVNLLLCFLVKITWFQLSTDMIELLKNLPNIWQIWLFTLVANLDARLY